MSDDIDIRHGAVVTVDTETLRAAAVEIDRIRDRLDDAASVARDARRIMMVVADRDVNGIAMLAGERADDLAQAIDRAGEQTGALATHLRRAALVYEYVELSARCDAARDPWLRAVFAAQLAALRAGNPGIDFVAGVEGLGYAVRAPWELIGQAWGAGVLLGPGYSLLGAASAWMLGAAVRVAGQGVVPAGARLQGTASPVIVTQIAQRASAPVGSLQQVAARIPDKAEIRVERYTMPGGTRQFVVYIAGTRSDTAFDMASNLELYGGHKSASYEAVRDALHSAGARSGDVVHEVGHSQGGMIADRIALEGEYDVRTIVTFGSPIQAEVPASTLVVDVRHDDDLVPSLAGGGSAQGVGSPESFVAQRTTDPAPVPDLGLMAHDLGRYEDTARLLDASMDPRMDAVRDVFSELGGATEVTVTDFTARRPETEAGALAPSAVRFARPAASFAGGAG